MESQLKVKDCDTRGYKKRLLGPSNQSKLSFTRDLKSSVPLSDIQNTIFQWIHVLGKFRTFDFASEVKCWLFDCVWLFVTPWTIAHQAPLSMEFSRQEYWSGLLCPSPGDPPNPGIEPGFPHVAGRFFTIWATRETLICTINRERSMCGIFKPLTTKVFFLFRGLAAHRTHLQKHCSVVRSL